MSDNTPTYPVASIPGDGIGKDVIASTQAVIAAAERRIGGFHLEYEEQPAGAGHYAKTGIDMPEEAEAECDRIWKPLLGKLFKAVPGVEQCLKRSIGFRQNAPPMLLQPQPGRVA